MKKINKGHEPTELSDWKAHNPTGIYKDTTESERQAIRLSCTKEQFYLCGYCCKRISGTNTDTLNEHVVPRDTDNSRSLDYSNIIASCTTSGQCDSSHEAKHLPLTPLMPECESELKFNIDGLVEGLTERARITIDILNLGDAANKNRKLVEARKQLFDNLLLTNQVDPSAGLYDEDLLKILMDDLKAQDEGKLLPYAPALTKMLESWL